MKRREALAGLGALGVFGVGAATAFTDFDIVSGLADGNDDADNGGTVDSFELPTFDAPGSDAGTATIPEPGRITYISMFATWCDICAVKMEPLERAYERVDDDVQFVSVTNEAVGTSVQPEDVVDWWIDHDGNWPVAHDDDLDLTVEVDARNVPFSVVVDADNQLTWSSLVSRTEASGEYEETILEKITDARA